LDDLSTSIRNRLPGTIEQIVSDKVVSEILVSTRRWTGNFDNYDRLSEADESQKGDAVFAIIKATEVSVEAR
jgi:molybdopterin-binding protein